ncbi:hypothetical protein JNJ66_01575 [Candidatus Saccharibacteria bacterium]|nr:hypothetical protein [Candidatus Saccharibacteria bacterium]
MSVDTSTSTTSLEVVSTVPSNIATVGTLAWHCANTNPSGNSVAYGDGQLLDEVVAQVTTMPEWQLAAALSAQPILLWERLARWANNQVTAGRQPTLHAYAVYQLAAAVVQEMRQICARIPLFGGHGDSTWVFLGRYRRDHKALPLTSHQQLTGTRQSVRLLEVDLWGCVADGSVWVNFEPNYRASHLSCSGPASPSADPHVREALRRLHMLRTRRSDPRP